MHTQIHKIRWSEADREYKGILFVIFVTYVLDCQSEVDRKAKKIKINLSQNSKKLKLKET